MNKSESKYFATSVRMDEAFLALLEKKDFAYITVKEICEAADVNRSTFYLHYETVNDLLTESVEYINRQFLAYMAQDSEAFVKKLRTCLKEELFLVTPEYLMPYLGYIKENKRVFRTAMENARTLRLSDAYDRMFQNIFEPILERFDVLEQDKTYIMTFYIQGLMAIITEWLKDGCTDSIEHIMAVIQRCVIPH